MSARSLLCACFALALPAACTAAGPPPTPAEVCTHVYRLLVQEGPPQSSDEDDKEHWRLYVARHHDSNLRACKDDAAAYARTEPNAYAKLARCMRGATTVREASHECGAQHAPGILTDDLF